MGKGKKSVARLHHYLPQTYLGLFTNTADKDGQFFVLEVETGHTFRTTPKNVASERDFNRVDLDGHSPDCMEQAFAPFEDSAIKAIRNTIASKTFPSHEDYNLIINFLGLIAVRNPHLRSSFNQSRTEVMNRVGDLLVSDPKIWEHHLRSAQEAGLVASNNVSYEDMKEFIEERRYKIEFSTESNLRIELKAFNKLLPILGKRFWSLFSAPSDGPEFICSDHPVTLVWKKGLQGPVGFGLKETEVFFPLSPSLGFYGTFEEALIPIVNLTARQVAAMNRRVALNAKRQVFSRLETFTMLHEGKVREVKCVVRDGV